MVDPDISDYEFTLTTYLGDNCIVFENFTASNVAVICLALAVNISKFAIPYNR
jgi:hypothetical protein